LFLVVFIVLVSQLISEGKQSLLVLRVTGDGSGL